MLLKDVKFHTRLSFDSDQSTENNIIQRTSLTHQDSVTGQVHFNHVLCDVMLLQITFNPSPQHKHVGIQSHRTLQDI